MPRPSKAAGSVALVTGANRGIGLAMVRELAARGAKKIYAGVRTPGALAGEFDGLAAAEVVPLDVTDPNAVRAVTAACSDVNLLVNNAGQVRARPAPLRTRHDQAAQGHTLIRFV
jgi:NAD(P)-dependent dehydrogenase (short-subunit alcohol dehydrogenase family)